MEIWANTLDVLSVSVISPSGESVPRLSARTGMTNVLKFIFENSQVEVDYRVVDTLSGYEVIFSDLLIRHRVYGKLMYTALQI